MLWRWRLLWRRWMFRFRMFGLRMFGRWRLLRFWVWWCLLRFIGLSGRRSSRIRWLLTSRNLWWRSGLGFCFHGRSGGRWSRATTRSARTSRAKRDLNTLLLAWSRLGVDIVLTLIVNRASVKGIIPIVRDGTIRPDSKAVCRCSTDIALELSCRGCQDATPSIGIREATIAVKTITSSRETAATDAILTIAKLAKNSRCAARRLKLEAL